VAAPATTLPDLWIIGETAVSSSGLRRFFQQLPFAAAVKDVLHAHHLFYVSPVRRPNISQSAVGLQKLNIRVTCLRQSSYY
jgi:hypothetical protein